jgi:hypothetical protein
MMHSMATVTVHIDAYVVHDHDGYKKFLIHDWPSHDKIYFYLLYHSDQKIMLHLTPYGFRICLDPYS